MIYYHFDSKVRSRGHFPSLFTDEQIKNEPMFFNCDLDFCAKNGGPITQAFLENLPQDWKDCNPVIDSRVHMLMKGWFPAIPGFHHDDVPRATPNGQPDYDYPAYHSEHLTGLINADIAPTLFAIGEHVLAKVENSIVYKEWHIQVEQQLKEKILVPLTLESGEYVEFNWQSMHTAQRAIKNGWRWFIRLSRNTDRQNHFTNEIRRQVQVYLENPMEGW